MTVVSKKNTSKKNTSKKAEVEVKKAVSKKAEVEVKKAVSNTQRCADMIIALARDAKHTRQEIVESVANAISALSIVTVKTMISDLQNSKYAKRYSTHTISIDKSTKIVTVASEIV